MGSATDIWRWVFKVLFLFLWCMLTGSICSIDLIIWANFVLPLGNHVIVSFACCLQWFSTKTCIQWFQEDGSTYFRVHRWWSYSIRGKQVSNSFLKTIMMVLFIGLLGLWQTAIHFQLRVCHKLTNKLKREVVLGSSSLDDPPQFLTVITLPTVTASLTILFNWM